MFKTTGQYLSDRIREETDLEDSEFITDEGMLRLINEVRRQVRGKIISHIADEGMLLEDTVLTVVDDKADLPEDFHTIFNIVGDKIFKPVSLSSIYEGTYPQDGYPYAIKKSQIVFPSNSNISCVTLLYYPIPPAIEALEDEIEFVHGEDQWIVYQCTAEVLRREETPNNEVLEKLKQIEREVTMQVGNVYKGSQRVVKKRRRY